MTRYDTLVRAQRQPARALGAATDFRELVRMGTLAASSHNTQPWRFRPGAGGIDIEPDLTRRCPVVDPDDGHLFKSLGCAAENVMVAAEAAGLRAEMEIVSKPQGPVVRIALEPSGDRSQTRSPASIAAAIPQRQCTKTAYDGREVQLADLRALEAAGTRPGVRMMLVTDIAVREALIELVRAGNIRQMGDARFRGELMEWIRFNDREAVAHADGLSGRTTGQPSVPRWLGRILLRFLMTPRSQSETDVRFMRSSPVFAVFLSEQDDAQAWIEAGRACQRFMLTATACGLRTAFINQPIEVADLRPQLASSIGVANEHPLLMLRVGYGPTMPYSLRRPLEAVIMP